MGVYSQGERPRQRRLRRCSGHWRPRYPKSLLNDRETAGYDGDGVGRYGAVRKKDMPSRAKSALHRVGHSGIGLRADRRPKDFRASAQLGGENEEKWRSCKASAAAPSYELHGDVTEPQSDRFRERRPNAADVSFTIILMQRNANRGSEEGSGSMCLLW